MPERGHALDQAAEKFVRAARLVVEVDEDEALPGFDSNGDKAVLRAIEIFDPFELGHALEGAIETVVPAVIRTMQEGSLAAGFGHDGGGVMTADIVESAQSAVTAADNDDRLTGNEGSHELAGRLHLFSAGHQLPGFAEHAVGASSSAMRGSTYQAAGMVEAWESGA